LTSFHLTEPDEPDDNDLLSAIALSMADTTSSLQTNQGNFRIWYLYDLILLILLIFMLLFEIMV